MLCRCLPQSRQRKRHCVCAATGELRTESYLWTAPDLTSGVTAAAEGAADSAPFFGDGSRCSSDSDEAAVSAPRTLRVPAASLPDPAACPVVWVSSDGRQAEFLWPHERPPNRRFDQQFSFGAIRLVEYSDGMQPHSWCRGDQHDCDPAVGELFGGSDRQDFPVSWGSGMPPCVVGARMIQHLGGAERLAAHFRTLRDTHFSEGSDATLIQPYQLDGRDYKVVRVSSGFENWGIVDVQMQRCRTCSLHATHCQHVAALAASVGDQPPTVPAPARPDSTAAQQWNLRFNKKWSYKTGQRDLTCISRQLIPEDPTDAPDCLDTYTGQSVNLINLNMPCCQYYPVMALCEDNKATSCVNTLDAAAQVVQLGASLCRRAAPRCLRLCARRARCATACTGGWTRSRQRKCRCSWPQPWSKPPSQSITARIQLAAQAACQLTALSTSCFARAANGPSPGRCCTIGATRSASAASRGTPRGGTSS